MPKVSRTPSELYPWKYALYRKCISSNKTSQHIIAPNHSEGADDKQLLVSTLALIKAIRSGYTLPELL